MTNIRLLIVDDHRLIRASLKALVNALPGMEVSAEANDGREAIELVSQHLPDVVLMDISMAGLNGLDATKQIKKDRPEARVIMLSALSSEQYVLQALRSGAVGYLLKESAPHELEWAIQSVMRGEMYLSPAISKHVIEVFLAQDSAQKSPLDMLTPRHREILQLIAEGKSTKQISVLLDASPKTIESHRSSLMERLDIHEVAGLVRYAIRNGLVSADA